MINTRCTNYTVAKRYSFISSILFDCCNKKLYSNFSDNNDNKIVGKIKHYPASNKEWKYSVYSYNKGYLKDMSFKYKLTNNLIKGHFSLSDKKNIARSKRMRGLIRRSSSKRVFVGNPEIKQTNDKVIITVYSFDRSKQSIIRNLYFYNRKSYLYNFWLINKYVKGSKNMKTFTKKHMSILKKTLFPYKNIKFRNESDFLRFRSLNLYKKFIILNKYFLFLFFSHILSIFKIKVLIPFNNNNKLNNKLIKNIFKDKPDKVILIINNKLCLYDLTHNNLNILVNMNNNNLITRNFDLDKINNYLWHFIENKFINNKTINKITINLLYRKFITNHYDTLIMKYFKKKTKILQYFIRLELNKLKFNNLLINLKSFIGIVYNKTVELNVINLKYVYLNSDIYTKFIADKLKKKANAVMTLQKSLNMVKIPHNYYLRNSKYNLNNLSYLNSYKSLNLSNINPTFNIKSSTQLLDKDKLNVIIDKLFPNSVINNNNNEKVQNNNNFVYVKENKIMNILNVVKNKWIKGIKLEIAGRLTRRNTAARSLFKFRYKGNLNNKQYYLESNYLYSMSTIMLRNTVKSNTQYTFLNSKKRIGAFGIKSWISSY